MPYVVIEDFSGGLDSRRLSVAGTPGTLLELVNAHITRGGEIEKRKAFAVDKELPMGTHGLATTSDALWVFGSDPEPGGLPAGVNYQRLQAPDNPDLVRVLSWDTFANRLYVAAEFSDGTTHHFYNGERVTNWFDGRARGSFQINATNTEAGAPSKLTIKGIEKGSDELDVQVFLVSADGETTVEATDPFTVPESDSSGDYRDVIRNEINAKTGDTGLVASDSGAADLDVEFNDPVLNREDWRLVFNVTIGLRLSITAEAQGSTLCSSDGGSCTVIWDLEAEASSGVPPYSYAWSIEDAGGADDVNLTSASGSTTQVQVTNATSAECTLVEVVVKCVATDDATEKASRTRALNSAHCTGSGPQ